MSTAGGRTHLPPEVATVMADAYSAYAQAVTTRTPSPERTERCARLANLAAMGRKAGWPVSALAEPCGITAERLRQIINEYGDGSKVPDVVFPKNVRPKKKESTPKKKPHLTARERKRIKELAPLARKNTGSTPLDSPIRKASKQFSALIIKCHEREVTWREIAEATDGVHQVSGLRMRAARHGYGKGAPPSIKPYRNIQIHATKKKRVVKKKDEVVATAA